MKLDYSKGLYLLLLAVISFYFSISLFDYFSAKSVLRDLSSQLALAKSQLYYLSRNVQRFSGPVIDFDLLDSQVRHVLSLTPSNELVFFWKEVASEDLNVYYGRS